MKMEEKFNVWLILDVTINILAILALIPIIVSYYKNSVIQILLIVLFIAWAFRPIWLACKNFKRDIKKKTKKKSISNKKIKSYLLFFIKLLIIILSIILSIILIQNKAIQLEYINNDNEAFRQISMQKIYNPNSWIDNINKLFGIPFDLNYYHFCFEDINTSSINSKHITYSNFIWDVNVSFNGIQERLQIKNSTLNCSTNSFSYNDKVFFNSVLKTNVTFFPNIENGEKSGFFPNSKVYAIPNEKTLLIKRIIFVLAFWTLILLIENIFKFLINKNERK